MTSNINSNQHVGVVTSPANQCTTCNSTDQKLMLCSRCHFAKYCSIECQRKDWPKHKETCDISKKQKEGTDIESALIELFKSTSRIQKLMYISGDKVGILYSPSGDVVKMESLNIQGKVALISERSLKKETVKLIKQYTPNQEAPSQLATGLFNGQSIFKFFGFE